MRNFHYRMIAAVFFLMVMSAVASGFAADKPADMGGWERGGKYDKLYVPSERDSFKGIVEGFKDVTPFPGMSPGVAVLVKDGDGDIVTVHLGPRWFVDPDATGIHKGDRVKVKGAWVTINHEDVVMASKISRGDFFEYKVRLTKDGTPFWTLDPQQLAKERVQSR